MRRLTSAADVALAATTAGWCAATGFWPGIIIGVLLLVAVRAGRVTEQT